MRPESLTTEAFAPFGEVLTLPDAPGRQFFNEALRTDRPGARPSLSLSFKESSAGPLMVRQMERHRFSSQSFVPLDPARFLVLVAPHAEAGGPDMARARAFLAGSGQGVTYGADVWHHPFTVVGAAARFAVFMWIDGTPDDEEFVDVTPFTLELP